MRDSPRRRPFWYLQRGPDRVAAEIDEELRGHLEMRARSSAIWMKRGSTAASRMSNWRHVCADR
jgi:hypothetical protein